MYFIFGIIFSFLIYIIIKPVLFKYAKDIPGERSSHLKIVPTGGGLIFVIPIIIYSLFTQNYLFLSLLPLVIIGFLDDILSISNLLRALIQILTIFFIAQFSYVFSSLPSDLISKILIIFVGFGIVNIFNFMDGLDGLLASCFLVILSRSIFYINPEISILFGSLVVFVIFNWNPAKIFMGDTGSTFLGAIYFIVLLLNFDFSRILMNLLIATPLLIDSTSCIFIRLFKKQNIFLPHKKHLYQRLHQAGFSHSSVSLMYLMATLFLVIISFLGNNFYLFFASLFIVSIGLFLNSNYAIRFE